MYVESDTQPGKTVALRSAWIDSQVRGFGRAICAFGYERFKKNCHKMVSVINLPVTYILNVLLVAYEHLIDLILYNLFKGWWL